MIILSFRHLLIRINWLNLLHTNQSINIRQLYHVICVNVQCVDVRTMCLCNIMLY